MCLPPSGVAGAGEGAGAGGGSGQLSYQLADNRCADFGTCHAEGARDDAKSAVNGKLLALYRAGLEAVHDASRCREAATYVEQIVAQMTVPLIQGAIKYAQKADPASGGDGETATDGGKAYAEFHAFTTAALPRVAQCDAAAGMKEIRRALLDADVNFKIAKSFTQRVKDKAIGQKVLSDLHPGQLLIKIVQDELTDRKSVV